MPFKTNEFVNLCNMQAEPYNLDQTFDVIE